MALFNLNAGLCLICVTLSLHSNRVVQGVNFETESTEGSIHIRKRDLLESPSRGLASRSLEKKQRFCLGRLMDALETVCTSSTDGFPRFFNPNSNEVSSVNISTVHFDMQRGSRQLKNNIPVMTHSRSTPLLRRRSRRNIVRECCENPCSYSHLRKYCSNSIRSYTTTSAPIAPEPASKIKIGKPSRRTNDDANTIVGLKISSVCLDNGDCINNDNRIDNGIIEEKPFTSSVQCIPVSDLKDYYRYKMQQKKESSVEVVPILESGEENEIEEEGEETSPSTNIRYSSNAITAKPITVMLSLPRGQNDYRY